MRPGIALAAEKSAPRPRRHEIAAANLCLEDRNCETTNCTATTSAPHSSPEGGGSKRTCGKIQGPGKYKKAEQACGDQSIATTFQELRPLGSTQPRPEFVDARDLPGPGGMISKGDSAAPPRTTRSAVLPIKILLMNPCP